MSQHFRPYQDIPILLEQASKQSSHVFNALHDYIITFSGDFSYLVDNLEKLKLDSLVHQDKKNSNAADIDAFHTELFKSFPHIAVNHLLQIPSFAFAAEELKRFASGNILNRSVEYTKRNGDLSQKAVEAISQLEKIRQINEQAYRNYTNAGVELKNAEQKGTTNLKPLQEAFLINKNKSIESHQKCREETEIITRTMETLLTSFEELEIWRLNEIKKVLIDFADSMVMISQKFIEGFTQFSIEYPDFPFGNDSSAFADFSLFRPAESDDFFQVWRVHPLTSKFLPLEDLFTQECQNGGQIFVVKENYQGASGHLSVMEGERVVGLEQKDNYFMCKNINMSTGLIPSRVLAFPN